MPKMIKIGEIRVLNYFDLPWNEPEGERWEEDGGRGGGESGEKYIRRSGF